MPKPLPAANDPAPPVSEREAERREHFMRVAAAVFRQHGLARATMEQVAPAAGVVHLQERRRNRYAELSARLPELAARVAAEPPVLAGSPVPDEDVEAPLTPAVGSLNR